MKKAPGVDFLPLWAESRAVVSPWYYRNNEESPLVRELKPLKVGDKAMDLINNQVHTVAFVCANYVRTSDMKYWSWDKLQKIRIVKQSKTRVNRWVDSGFAF